MEASALDDMRIALDPAGQAGIALSLVLIMFGVALGLKREHFRFLRAEPLLFLGGVATQMAGLPLLTLLLVMAANPPPSIALGMLIVASCPGGAASNLLTFLARGNVAYSVSLTATSSVAAAFVTPVSILFWSNAYPPTAALLDSIDFNAVGFLIQTTILLAVPLAAGMTLAHYRPGLAERYRRQIALAGAAVIAGVILYGLVRFFPILIAAADLLIPIAILHNALAFALGAGAGFGLTRDGPTRRALLFEVGIQNAGLALVILLSQLQGVGGATAIAGVWGIWHLVAGALIVMGLRALDRRSGAP